MKDLQEQLSANESKYSSLEKTKNRIAAELEDVSLDLEKVINSLIVASISSLHIRNVMLLLHGRKRRRPLTNKSMNGSPSLKLVNKNWMLADLNLVAIALR